MIRLVITADEGHNTNILVECLGSVMNTMDGKWMLEIIASDSKRFGNEKPTLHIYASTQRECWQNRVMEIANAVTKHAVVVVVPCLVFDENHPASTGQF